MPNTSPTDRRTAFETQLMIELRETREDFAMMTAEATRLEEEIELQSSAEVDAALRIAYLEERVLELQLLLARARQRASFNEKTLATVEVTSGSDLGTALWRLRSVLVAGPHESTIGAAERVVRERDSAIADAAVQRGPDMRQPLAAPPAWSAHPEVMVRRVMEGRQIDAAAEARKQEQQIRDADLRTIHAGLVAHGARLPEEPVFEAIMAGIADLGDRASRTLPGSMARAAGEAQVHLAQLTSDLAAALGWSPGDQAVSGTEIVREVRANRDSRASLARALESLRHTIAGALRLASSDLSDSDLIAAIAQQREDLEAARVQLDTVARQVAGFTGATVAERVHNLLLALGKPASSGEKT